MLWDRIDDLLRCLNIPRDAVFCPDDPTNDTPARTGLLDLIGEHATFLEHDLDRGSYWSKWKESESRAAF